METCGSNAPKKAPGCVNSPPRNLFLINFQLPIIPIFDTSNGMKLMACDAKIKDSQFINSV